MLPQKNFKEPPLKKMSQKCGVHMGLCQRHHVSWTRGGEGQSAPNPWGGVRLAPGSPTHKKNVPHSPCRRSFGDLPTSRKAAEFNRHQPGGGAAPVVRWHFDGAPGRQRGVGGGGSEGHEVGEVAEAGLVVHRGACSGGQGGVGTVTNWGRAEDFLGPMCEGSAPPPPLGRGGVGGGLGGLLSGSISTRFPDKGEKLPKKHPEHQKIDFFFGPANRS